MPNRSDAPDIPANPLEWRPQLARATGPRAGSVRDPIIEPHWSGMHVLAHFDADRRATDGGSWLRLVDLEGEDATGVEPDVAAALRDAIMAVDAVVDGFLTAEATRTGEGVSIAGVPKVPRLAMVLPRGADVEVEPIQGHDRGGLVAFVAVDLLRLDGVSLLDIPLLERKRLLESVIQPSDLVRLSPYTRPPLAPWLASWRSAGLAGAVLKAANSRYRPATVTSEWTVVVKTGRG